MIMLKYILNITIISVWIILGASTGFGGGNPFEPWEFGDRPASHSTVKHEKGSVSLPARMALEGLNFFSEYISKVDGDRCPMYPTCASYSRQAFRKHGFLVGIVMTADRLIHESNEMEYVPRVKVGGTMRYYDPVSWNDYWWYRAKGIDK